MLYSLIFCLSSLQDEPKFHEDEDFVCPCHQCISGHGAVSGPYGFVLNKHLSLNCLNHK